MDKNASNNASDSSRDGSHSPRPLFRKVPGLQVVVAGAGRDGTMSMAKLIRDLATANGDEMVVEHELYANHVCNLLCQYRETGYRFYLHVLQDLLRNIPAHAVSGTTYQFVLDMFAEIHGPSLKLIHLKRKNRQECIQSLVDIVYYRPAMAINMVREECRKDCEDYTFRVAAFHFGETTRERWDELSAEERLAWHYDKTHELIEQGKKLFRDHLTVYTEELGQEQTIRRIARFIDPSWNNTCPPVHLNSRASWKEHAEKNEAIRRDMLAPSD